MLKNKMPRLLIAVMCCVFLAGAVLADELRQIDIPPGDLIVALEALASESGVELIYRSDQLEGLRTRGVSGRLSPQEAVTKLLEGTPLTLKIDSSGALLITLAHATPHESRADPDLFAPIQLEEVVVTGSRLLRTTAEGAQEVKTYSARQIEQSGQTTLADFLGTLPEVSTQTPEAAMRSQTAGSNGTTVTLRGLPIGTTLVLLNGRRIDNGPVGNYFDINAIPAMAIERIEIVPEGSSAVYGSDALAGVVNIVLKQNIEGAELDVHHGHTSGSDDSSATFGFGDRFAAGSFSLLGNFYTRGELDTDERAITSNLDYTAFGGPDNRGDYTCTPGTVYSTNTSNLPGLSSTRATIPPGLQGTPTVASFGPGAGQQNLCSGNAALEPETHRFSLVASGNYDLSAAASLFTEVLYSRVEQTTEADAVSPLYLYDGTVSATNPYNPFGKAVQVSETIPTDSGAMTNTTSFVRALVGARGALPHQWNGKSPRGIPTTRTASPDRLAIRPRSRARWRPRVPPPP